MDDAVRAAMAKWPAVPAVFGWLSLDARGQWRVADTPVRHAGLAAFIGRNYLADAAGRWYFQNGPQQVFVSLAYTPWVFRLAAEGTLSTHTGAAVDTPSAAWLDEAGHLLISCADGSVGLLHDADLAQAIESFQTQAGDAVDPAALLDAGAWPADAGIALASGWVPLSPILRREVAGRFGFVTDPTDESPDNVHCRP
ncbi:DUF2946 family protein [Denitromonas iodatirespirans]|uniref:DUF2946 family protein n=1 Tax=Denitromonas iodatirespirans TaxID=2795389 RepID=A0A944DG89_DENI1|nr:DUF2946 family protein [Denitromonas iodatirespirans]MBT0963647.1 DUF2946 family protein [Denitromonas iodatirespirans]